MSSFLHVTTTPTTLHSLTWHGTESCPFTSQTYTHTHHGGHNTPNTSTHPLSSKRSQLKQKDLLCTDLKPAEHRLVQPHDNQQLEPHNISESHLQLTTVSVSCNNMAIDLIMKYFFRYKLLFRLCMPVEAKLVLSETLKVTESVGRVENVDLSQLISCDKSECSTAIS